MEKSVKIVFIYNVPYGSLLVRCHRVVNKGCRFVAVRFVAVPVFTHESHPGLRLRRALCLAFVAPVFAHHLHPLKNSTRVKLGEVKANESRALQGARQHCHQVFHWAKGVCTQVR